jgi:ribosomal protein L22
MADEKKKAKAKKPAKKPAAKKAAPKKEPAKKAAAKKAARASDKVADRKAKGGQGGGASAGGGGRAAEQPPVRKSKKHVPIMVRASSRYVRVAPRKARLIADQVRGLQIDQARALLQFSPRSAAHDIGKLIESAASNAENNHDLDADEMRVAEITVDEGPTLKRYRPRALGRATPIHKRTSHIAVDLMRVV